MADLPGVGENLMDHPAVMLWMVPKEDQRAKDPVPHQVMARVASRAQECPDLNLIVLSRFQTARVPMLTELLKSPVASAISVVLMNPASRGRVFLEHAAPGGKPVIELNFGSAPGATAWPWLISAAGCMACRIYASWTGQSCR